MYNGRVFRASKIRIKRVTALLNAAIVRRSDESERSRLNEGVRVVETCTCRS